MKNTIKILLSLIIIMFIPISSVYAEGSIVEGYINNISGDMEGALNEGSDSKKSIDSIIDIVNKVLGFLQVMTALLVVIVIASTGFRYIVETPEVKGDIKATMLPMIIGIIFVFFAVSISRFFVGLFSNIK